MIGTSLAYATLSTFSAAFGLSLEISVLSSESTTGSTRLGAGRRATEVTGELLHVTRFLFCLRFVLRATSSATALVHPDRMLQMHSPTLVRFPSQYDTGSFIWFFDL